jgi:hypothetical protein
MEAGEIILSGSAAEPSGNNRVRQAYWEGKALDKFDDI